MIKKNIYVYLIFLFCLFFKASFSSEITSLEKPEHEKPNKNSTQPVKNSSNYFALGGGLLGLPSLQFGKRSQYIHNGIDISIQASGFFYFLPYLKLNILYLYFPKPNLQKQIYFGAGIGYLHGVMLGDIISPEFILGKEFQTKNGKKRFFQGQISWPNTLLHSTPFMDFPDLPQISISYGWIF